MYIIQCIFYYIYLYYIQNMFYIIVYYIFNIYNAHLSFYKYINMCVYIYICSVTHKYTHMRIH